MQDFLFQHPIFCDFIIHYKKKKINIKTVNFFLHVLCFRTDTARGKYKYLLCNSPQHLNRRRERIHLFRIFHPVIAEGINAFPTGVRIATTGVRSGFAMTCVGAPTGRPRAADRRPYGRCGGGHKYFSAAVCNGWANRNCTCTSLPEFSLKSCLLFFFYMLRCIW